ncbi:MAG: PQQ-binding-like beta-propeller repeat protein [Chlorobi bacterium]|nr:PQQ-binding-like beta-propeller repeat protein [Chlorobiota bacterium]
MKIKIRLLVLLFLVSVTMLAGYRGRVYIDGNMNQKYDEGEAFLPGIRVTDGKNVVVTNDKGEFDLPGFKAARFIYITVPAGYQASGKFYVNTEPDKYYYDIGVKKYDRTSKNVRFIQLADTEDNGFGKWIKYIRDYAALNDVGFIMHTGDICYEDGLKFHADYVNSETMGVPVYYCIGEHDLVKGDYGEQMFEKLFGPVYYSFNAGNTHFIVTPVTAGDHKPSYTPEQIYNWLVNDLKNTDPSMNLVVFNHDLLTFDGEFIFKSKNGKLNFNEHNLKAWIYGHWHINFLKNYGDNGLISVCSSTPDKGGINHSPSNFLVYDISADGRITVKPRYNYIDKHLVVAAPSDDELLFNSFGKMIVSVNSYNTISPSVGIKGALVKVSGEKINFELKQNTDWNWSANVKLDETWLNKNLLLTIGVKYKDGENSQTVIPIGHASTDVSLSMLKEVWVKNCKGNIWMAPPVEANGKVYAGTIDDFGLNRCGIHAYNAASGSRLWRYKTKGSVKNTFCYYDGKILATDNFGIAYAVDANTGDLIWEKELGQTTPGGYITGNVVYNGVYYTGYGNYLQALDAKTGKRIWINQDWRGGDGAASTMIVEEGVLIAAADRHTLYAHDIKTGRLLWKFGDKRYRLRSSSATWKDDTLYVASDKGIGLFNIHTGELYKYLETGYDLMVATRPLIINDILVMGTKSNGLVAFNRYNGKEVWKVITGDALIYTSPYSRPESCSVETPPVLVNESIVFGASDGFVYWVDPEDGEVIEKYNLGAPVFGAVTPYLNGFFVTDFGGNIYRFTMKSFMQKL